MNISDLSPQKRLLGAALGIAFWLLPAFGVWLYMTGRVNAAEEIGAADARAKCAERNELALANAIRAARAEWEKTQRGIDDRAKRDAEAIAADLAAVRRQTSRITKEFRSYVDARPLPPDCRADPERIRLWNDARRGRPAEG